MEMSESLRDKIRAIIIDVAGGNCNGPCPSVTIKCENCGTDRIIELLQTDAQPYRVARTPVSLAGLPEAPCGG